MATEYVPAAQYALHAVQEGWSAQAGVDRYRAEGGHIADSTWRKLYGEVQRMHAERGSALNEPQRLRPVASEIRTWTTSQAKGFVQQVEVLVRDRDTGEIISVPYSGMGRTLRSRIAVINEALSVYSDENAVLYNQQILGAVYTGTYEASPEAV